MADEKKNQAGNPENNNNSTGYSYPNYDYGSYFPYYPGAPYASYSRATPEADYTSPYSAGGYQQTYPGYSPQSTPGGYGAPTGYGGMPYGAEGTYGYPGATPPPPPQSGGPVPGAASAAPSSTGVEVPGLLPSEQSYIENILRLNLGKVATVYMTFENNTQWNAKVFQGIIRAAGRDHIILEDPTNKKRYLLLMIYLNYITFDGDINYSYSFE